jgi:hypothetical protein
VLGRWSGAIEPFERNQLVVVTPLLRKSYAVDLAPDISTCVIEDDCLELPLCSHDYAADRLEHGPNCRDIFVSSAARSDFILDGEASWEIDLLG